VNKDLTVRKLDRTGLLLANSAISPWYKAGMHVLDPANASGWTLNMQASPKLRLVFGQSRSCGHAPHVNSEHHKVSKDLEEAGTNCQGRRQIESAAVTL
jgi:hypothetical protein